jgi:dihydrofolate reductase
MGKLRSDISMSLDGFIAGQNMTPEQGLGEGGEQLHEWVVRLASWRRPHGLEGGDPNGDNEVFEESQRNLGAFLMGRHMFGGGDGPWGDPAWGDKPWEGWWGDEPPFHMPVIVLTHHPREPLTKGETTFTFVTDGIESALEQAQAAAGAKDVLIGGGASVIQQYLAAGLLDELQVHVVPVLLGEGVRLFENLPADRLELENTSVAQSPAVTHIKYRVVKPG